LEPRSVERKLAAIFAADVEGYSRLMGRDEVGTLRKLNEYRVIIDRLIASYRGRIFTTAGDSVLADFASAVDAVQCAVAVQDAIAKENAGRPAGEQMRFRIGVHVGDIIVQGDNLFGDAVNVAARLEALAEPGGICVSGTVQDQIGTKLPVEFMDLGPQQVKNITQPIKAYRIRDETLPSAAPVVDSSLPLPDKPSIAVLPFANMSGDPEQEYFADGMVEEIITALSRIRWLFVIARNSSFTYKGQSVDVKQVGRELGVRYVLEGSVRKAGGRVRITGQLINATTGTHIWADRFDGSLVDVFDLQDQIATSVAGVIEPPLRQAEIERAQKRPDSLDAYDLYLRALPFAYTSMPEDAGKALGYLEQAIRLDADFAVVHAIIAWCHEQRYLRGGLDENAKAIALRHAHLAIAMGGDDPTALAIAGLVIGFLEPREYDVAVSAFDRALTLSNSSALALGFSAVSRAWHGESTIAIEQAEQALRLSPLFDPLSKERHMAIAIAHFVAGRFEESASAASRAIQANPRFSPPYWMRCAALASLGRIDEAEAVTQVLLNVQPEFTIGSITSAPFAKPEILTALGDALHRVGLPE
jgi:adenylate cyclase